MNIGKHRKGNSQLCACLSCCQQHIQNTQIQTFKNTVKNQVHWGHISVLMDILAGRQTSFLNEIVHCRKVGFLKHDMGAVGSEGQSRGRKLKSYQQRAGRRGRDSGQSESSKQRCKELISIYTTRFI